MKVLVAGASGLVGCGIIKALKTRGHEVVGLFHNPKNAEKVKALGATPQVVDLESGSLAEAARGCDVIIHAAQPEYYSKRLSTSFVAKTGAVDAQWTKKLLEAGKGQAKTFIYTSGAWVYGATGEEVADEQRALNCYPAGAYKPASEQIALSDAKRLGYTSSVVIRPGAVYGLGSAFGTFVLAPMQKGKKATLIGNGQNWVSYLHADDLGELYALAAEKGPGFEVYNAADDEPARAKVAVGFLAEKMGAPPPGGAPAFIVGLFIGHAASAISSSLKITSQKAKTALGWKLKYPTYREGFAEVARAAKAQ